MHKPKARQVDWLNVALVLRDQATIHSGDAMKFEDDPNPRAQLFAIQHGTTGLVLLDLAIAIERGTLEGPDVCARCFIKKRPETIKQRFTFCFPFRRHSLGWRWEGNGHQLIIELWRLRISCHIQPNW